jgi:hypothetical protein
MTDSPKLDMFCALSRQEVFGPFFFAEHTVKNWHGVPRCIGGIPYAYFGRGSWRHAVPTWWPNFTFPWVTDFSNRKIAEKWIGRGGPITWPPGLPDLFFLGYIKDVLPLATTLLEHGGRISSAMAAVTFYLVNVCQKLDHITYSNMLVFIPLPFSSWEMLQ